MVTNEHTPTLKRQERERKIETKRERVRVREKGQSFFDAFGGQRFEIIW